MKNTVGIVATLLRVIKLLIFFKLKLMLILFRIIQIIWLACSSTRSAGFKRFERLKRLSSAFTFEITQGAGCCLFAADDAVADADTPIRSTGKKKTGIGSKLRFNSINFFCMTKYVLGH